VNGSRKHTLIVCGREEREWDKDAVAEQASSPENNLGLPDLDEAKSTRRSPAANVSFRMGTRFGCIQSVSP
jgi:hypothetical protein